MPPSGVDYASEFLNGYAPEYVYSVTETSQRIKSAKKKSDFTFHR